MSLSETGERLSVRSEKVYALARILKAASHPTRLMILAELTKGIRCVSRIQNLLEVRQGNLSQHLAALRESGLVASHRDGVFRCYYLTKPGLVKALLDVLSRDYPTAKVTREEALRVRIARQHWA